MKIKQLTALVFGVLLTGLVSCEYQTIVPYDVIVPETPVDFSTQIEPIFTQLDCVSCHTGSFEPNFTVGKAYASLVSKNLFDTANPSNSKLILQINSGHNTTVNMTAEQKALRLRWITEGAKGVVPPVSFKTEVEPLFAAVGCVQCHSGSQIPDLRVGKAFASLTSNNFVIANNSDGSKLIQYIKAGHNTAPSLTAAQKALITKWIMEGIKNN